MYGSYCAPILYKITKMNGWMFIFSFFGGGIVYFFICTKTTDFEGILGVLVNTVLLQIVGYGLIYWIALFWNGFNKIQKKIVLIVCGGLTVAYIYAWI